jgi:hypothetical protein
MSTEKGKELIFALLDAPAESIKNSGSLKKKLRRLEVLS